ncbi:MAG: hypothetical protein LBG19_04810 [Prevotellaceae bacterium]|jgi:predicted metallo-beta-lactamase superfamily hydrolase|nr:hypothetical protein [Prevotellaceae bacterium]
MAKKGVEQKSKKTSSKSEIKKGFFSGGWLTSEFIRRQHWYILFIFGLALFYIAYRYYSESAIYQKQELEKIVKTLQAEHTIKSEELIRINKRSEIIKQAKQKGLELIESPEPPKRISVD